MQTKRSPIIIAVAAIAIAVCVVWYAQAKYAPASAGDASASNNPPPAMTATSTRIISMMDSGKTISFKTGDRFVVELGALQWTLSFSDPSIASRVKGIMMMKGAQGIFTAVAPGTTTLIGQGRPVCDPGQMCPQFIANFQVTIVVK